MPLPAAQIRDTLDIAAKAYLPAGSHAADFFDRSYKNGIIHTIDPNGTAFDFANNPEDVQRAAEAAYQQNLAYLKQKDITVTLSEQELFLVTFIYGHQGAIPYLKGEKPLPDKMNSIIVEANAISYDPPKPSIRELHTSTTKEVHIVAEAVPPAAAKEGEKALMEAKETVQSGTFTKREPKTTLASQSLSENIQNTTKEQSLDKKILERIAQYDKAGEYASISAPNIQDIKTHIFLDAIASGKSFEEAFDTAAFEYKIGDGVMLNKVVVEETLGGSDISFSQFRQKMEERTTELREQDPYISSKEIQKAIKREAKEAGVRGYLSLNLVGDDNIRIKLNNPDMQKDAYHFFGALAKAGYYKRRKDGDDMVRLYPSQPKGNEAKTQFTLADKLFILAYIHSNAAIADDFFDGETLRIDEDNRFHFTPADYFSKDMVPATTAIKLDGVDLNARYNVPFNPTFFTHAKYKKWNATLNPKSIDEQDVWYRQDIQKLYAAQDKFTQGGVLDVRKYGRNFTAVNNRYHTYDGASERVALYKEHYATISLRNIKKEKAQQSKALDTQAIETAIETIRQLKAPKGLEEAKEILHLTAQAQLLRAELEATLATLDHPKDKRKAFLTADMQDNIYDIKLFERESYNALAAINSLLLGISDEARKHIAVLFKTISKEQLFTERVWTDKGLSAEGYMLRENLVVDPILRASAKNRDALPHTLYATAATFLLPGSQSVDGWQAGVGMDIRNHLSYPLGVDKNPNLTLHANAKNANISYNSAPELFGKEKHWRLPFQRTLQASNMQSGDVTLRYKPSELSALSWRTELSSNSAIASQKMGLHYEILGVHKGNATAVGPIWEHIGSHGYTIHMVGAEAKKNMRILSANDWHDLTVSTEAGYARIGMGTPEISDHYNSWFATPSASWKFNKHPFHVGGKISATVMGGFHDPYKQNSLQTNLFARGMMLGDKTQLSLHHTLQWMQDVQLITGGASLKYKIGKLKLQTDANVSYANMPAGKLTQLGLRQEVELLKNTLLGITIQLPFEENMPNPTPRSIGGDVGISVKF